MESTIIIRRFFKSIVNIRTNNFIATQECMPFQYRSALAFNRLTTKSTILRGTASLRLVSPFTPGFVNVWLGTLDHEFQRIGINHTIPFLTSLETTVKTRFMKLGSNLYMKQRGRKLKLWEGGGGHPSELTIFYMKYGLGIKWKSDI